MVVALQQVPCTTLHFNAAAICLKYLKKILIPGVNWATVVPGSLSQISHTFVILHFFFRRLLPPPPVYFFFSLPRHRVFLQGDSQLERETRL